VGQMAHFLFVVRYMGSAPESLVSMIRSSVEPMGYELVGVEYLSQGASGHTLRIYIDHVDGITVDDCVAVSHQVSGVLDVEDPIHGNYDLEVSSPGLDRPLFYKEHFERFIGHQVKVVMHSSVEGRRRFKGLLKGVKDDELLLVVDDQEFVLPLEQIEKARLVPEF